MQKHFRDLSFPPTYKYSSDSEFIPLEFYEEAFPISKNIDLLLGYFSSNAIKVLSKSLAEFLYNGGKMRIITNHVYSLMDYENLVLNPELKDEDKWIDLFEDLSKIEKNLSAEGIHFFDCLKYLLKVGRLEILPVKFNDVDLAHCKTMILYDGVNYIVTDGSINFTLSALLKNSESFQVETPWNGKISQRRIEDAKNNFERIFSKQHPAYNYIDKDKIEVVINAIGRDKDIQDLFDDSLELQGHGYSEKVKKIIEKKKERFNDKLEIILNTPKFPFPQGPREYQKEAYNEWVKKDYSGVFAMATGTGKTITSLNCLLNIFNEEKKYRAIILVPSIALLNQWEEEVNSFNFRKILKVGGGSNWEKEFSNYCSNYSWGLKEDLVIISTYGSFVLDRFQKLFKKIQKDFLLIADEAHNMGANNIKSKLSGLEVTKKIGLSATPKRIYDPEGTIAIDKFFKDEPPYTYSFGMEKALEYGFLTGYKYFPKIVELTEEEFEEYTEISKKLLKFFDFENSKFKDDPIVEILLLKRKNIIHKASNKLNLFSSIVGELIKNKKDQFVFAYIPEGNTQNSEGDRVKILNQYLRRVHRDFPKIKMNSYTSEDQNLSEILRGFEDGKIEVLFAMKMLDEGVDIPRAEVGIFASSTGNPRQFIQRRGRLLRKHKDKAFATIYDMVVVPKLDNNLGELYNIERNLVKNELNRVGYFASLSMNFYDSKETLDEVCKKYDLDLDTIINEL
ncbi:DEAD/DEAH box helicase family protein [Flavobacterium litorale]|uniref:DEAD/DEAH box helicase family protein n=1 Tax=Flavobacterium litorale TaxID=2856519 RepID=A0ABX8VDR6_9FLAO|nr:DEAD/DEAH box helicase family protein [Flavobacterium litorale]QYJ68799.1 DEAD/DEAH box helicase family protein [Flavobacterium litorale]